MSVFRRVVTGHDAEGRSIVARDDQVHSRPVPGMPAIELTTLWGADEPMRYPDDGSMPDFRTWFAPVGGFRLIEFVVGPDAPAPDDADPDATRAAVDAAHTCHQLFGAVGITVEGPVFHVSRRILQLASQPPALAGARERVLGAWGAGEEAR